MTAFLILLLAMDLGSIRNGPNLERRSDLAMDYANSALDAARDAFTGENAAKMEAGLDEVGDSVDLASFTLR